MKPLYQSGPPNRDISTPSWVPGCSQFKALERNFLALAALVSLVYKAAANTSPQVRLANDKGEIFVSEGYIDTVSRTTSRETGIWESESDCFRVLINTFKEADSFILNGETYVTGEPLIEVQWRTLVGNCRVRLAASE